MNIDWSFLRSVLAQGTDIQKDYTAGKYSSYEEFAARLDSAAHERLESLAPSATEAAVSNFAISDELFRLLETTLQYYGQHSEARMGARTGGVVAGCPRGRPYIDQGEYADKAQEALQKWALECRDRAAASPAKQPKGEA